jgi:hypothetical protein
LPLGEEKDFVGVADLVTEKADVYHDDQSGSSRRWRCPPEIQERPHLARHAGRDGARRATRT